MSLESWKKEFYPKPARLVSKRGAAKHSLRKWIGLRTENLDKHGLDRSGHAIFEVHGPTFYIDGDSCALCKHYAEPGCPNCPLAIAFGRSCDDDGRSPWRIYINTGNPEPMIALLQKICDSQDK